MSGFSTLSRCVYQTSSGASAFDRLIGHQCERTARWSVTTPTGETLRICTQHLRKLERYWGDDRLAVAPLPY